MSSAHCWQPSSQLSSFFLSFCFLSFFLSSMLSLSCFQNSELCPQVGDLPAWVWLPYLQHLLISLQRPEMQPVKKVRDHCPGSWAGEFPGWCAFAVA